ncbi:MAG: beta-galactosidase [Planctomycetota bacterium]
MNALRTALLGAAGAVAALLPAQQTAQQTGTEGKRAQGTTFANGLPAGTFPLGVWLQAPGNAKRYRELGIDLYVGLWEGPTRDQLAALERAGMRVICAQNEVGLAHRGKAIVGWMHGDEPDNAQGRRLKGYAPPILPTVVQADYQRLRQADATRPILLNLGQGAAWDGWHGRGERTNHPEDYPEYCKGCDVVSFDIYPVTHDHRDVAGKLEFVGEGVQRLRKWTGGNKPVWACIETGHVNNAKVRPTPEQVRAEVWIAIASGASGIVFFAHEFAPQFVEAGLLAHPEIADAVRAICTEVHAAAPVLSSPQVPDAVAVANGGELAVRAHEHGGALWLFVASLQDELQPATFTVKGATKGRVEVAGDARPIALVNGVFRDEIPAYGIRHYRLPR